MDPTCGLAEKFRDIVLDLIWEQLHYLVCYGQNIEQLHERLEELTLERSSIQHRIDEATNIADQEIDEKVVRWMGKVDEISEQVQNLHHESQGKRECSITSCPNPWLRYKLSKRAKAMAQQVANICGEGNFDGVSYSVPPKSMPELTNGESNEGIDSRVPIMNQIMEALWNPSVHLIGLCGLGGVGKTTIAKEVAIATHQNRFEKVIMVTVSQELNIEMIQRQIAEKLGIQINETTEDVIASRLRERLKQKNMLLILDDLWEKLDLAKVGIPLIEGCKILLTSRDETLLSNRMNCQKIIKVGVFLEDEALELFKKIAELPIDSSSSELIPIAIEIVRTCGGLPLAIATAAKALRGKDLNEWKDYCARLNNPLRRNVTGIKEVDVILKVSVDLLSSENKDIFLLTGMLSHDPLIEELLMYTVGLDILKGIDNMKEAHEGIFAIVNKLKSLNLFLDSFSSHRVTIHDVVRDIALSIASNELRAFVRRRLKEWPDENMLEDCKGICLQESDISVDLPEELHGPNLQFFMLNSKKRDLTIPSMFFRSSKELKVLELTNVHIPSLQSLSFLQKLKTLCLHSCLLENISEVRSLKKLKVLSLAYSEIQQLPVQVAELTSLQMLNLSHCSKLKVIPPKILSSLKKLEVLSMGNSFSQWKVKKSSEANENASLDELKGLPIYSLDIHIPNISILPEDLFFNMNLKRYIIFIGKHWEWQGNYGNSKTLKLELESSIHLKRGVWKLLEGVEDLSLYGSNVSNEVFKSLFNSKVLLPKIERLELSNLNHLIPFIWDEQLSENSFSNLKTLIVRNCGFVKLVPLHVLKSLNNLEELEVEQCENLEMVFDFEDLNDYKGRESSLGIVPLKKLRLWELPKLKNVWSDDPQGIVSFPSLRRIDVYICKSLTSMFPASIAKGMLFHLEDLRISYCGIDVIVAKDQVSESVDAAFEFPTLTSLTLEGLTNLRNFYPQRHTLKWSNLQELSIVCCDELEIFEKKVSSSSEIHEEESTLNSRYPLLSYKVINHNLEELTLVGKEVEMIGSDQFPTYHFPKVKLLYLSNKKTTTISYASLLRSFSNLESLQLDGDFKESFRGDDVAALAPRLSTFTLSNISNMISLVPSLVSSPNLTYLQVTYCNRLTILMTSSAARCLVHLTYLSISYCDQMEEIITKHEGEDDEDKEIFFSKLELLELYGLPRLKRFCGHNYTFKFPFLDQLTITRCPEFKIFSPGTIDTPSLKSVQLSQNSREHREIWDTDLYKTFYQQRFVASRELVLDKDDAIMIRNIDQFPADPCPKVEILRIERIVDEGLTIPYALLERIPQLKALHVEDCSFEEIFPSHVPLSSTSFLNLTDLKVSQCHQLVYLVTNSIAKSLVNLDTLEIDDCKNMEEIVRKEPNEDIECGITFNGLRILRLAHLPRLKTKDEDKRDVNIEDGATNSGCRSLFGHNSELLPKLEILELSNSVNNLISFIWGEQILHNSFSNLKTLIVQSCDFIKVVPLHVLKSLNNLEKLQVSCCNKLEMVFGFDYLNDYKEQVSSLVAVPLNLTHVKVEGCHGLTTLMKSSAARCLVHLIHFSVSYCDEIEEIITKQEGEDDENKEIFFSKLEFLGLYSLPRLKRFCSHNYAFKFPLLERVTINECPQLTMFCPVAIHAPLVESVLLREYETPTKIWKNDLNTTIQHQFAFEQVISTTTTIALNAKNITVIKDVFPEVESLYIEGFQDEGVTFPYSSLERFPKLNWLYVEHCSFDEIFSSHDKIVDFVRKVPQFKGLCIAHLDQLKCIWNDDSQLPPIHQNLGYLKVKSCCNLFKLAPSSASFQYLWKLSISGCHQLIHLVTTSTAKSLVSLIWLEINDCKNMEEIVMNETNEDVQGPITFNQLRSVELTDMPSLKMFSLRIPNFEFPKLEEIQITGCPEMKMFCQGELETPNLSKVKIEDHDMGWKDGEDLNKTIEMLSSAKVISTTTTIALNAKNITVIKDVFPEVESLYIEGFQDEGVTFPYSSLERFPKLNWLYVEHCSFDEIFSSHDKIVDFVRKVPQFKGLCIAHLDQLKCIWNDDSQLPPIHQNLGYLKVKSCCNLFKLAPSSASFQYLWKLSISGCHQLIHLVTTSTAKSLVSLIWLEINDCKNMEEIVMNETNEDVQGPITFNQLRSVELTDMPSLKMFSLRIPNFEFPKLEEIQITGCPEMKMFCQGELETPNLSKVKIEDHDMGWKDGEDLNKTIEMLSSAKDSINI